jgi:hypothetical protein
VLVKDGCVQPRSGIAGAYIDCGVPRETGRLRYGDVFVEESMLFFKLLCGALQPSTLRDAVRRN